MTTHRHDDNYIVIRRKSPKALPPALRSEYEKMRRAHHAENCKVNACVLTLDKRSLPHRSSTTEAFFNRIRASSEFGRSTIEIVKDGIPFFINQYWTQKQRDGKSLQGLTYHGSFKPSLVTFFIDQLSEPGNVVHDPFAGRGTVPIEAALMNRVAIGSDINPLFPLLARPRLNAIRLGDVARALVHIDWAAGTASRDDLYDYFHPETFQKMEALRLWIDRYAPLDGADPDPTADWVRMVALSRLTGHSPGFLCGITLPPGRMTTIAKQQKMNVRTGNAPSVKNIPELILKKSKELLRDGCVESTLPHRLGVGPAWDTPWIEEASVDLVLTSPPFADVLDYGHDNWMKAWFAGIDIDSITFSHHRSLTDWTAMIRRTLIELIRVVRPGGYIAMEVGEIRKGQIDLARYVWQAAEGLDCDRCGVVVQHASFTKASHRNGTTNGTLGTNSNRIVVMQRH